MGSVRKLAGGITLYEISSRPWLYELRKKYGAEAVLTVGDIPDAELERIAEYKCDMVWLQGVWKLGAIGLDIDRKEESRMSGYRRCLPDFTLDDVIGSPYAIVEYKVSDDLGGDPALKQFRERLKKLGMKLMLDMVPNHMAIDSVWAEDPKYREYFIQKPDHEGQYNPADFSELGLAHGKDPYTGAWIDTLQLNYWNPNLRKAQTENLIKIASQCDGIRVDMAMLLINHVVEKTWGKELKATGYSMPKDEFWTTAIKEMREAGSETILMAEVYWELDSELFAQGFDFTYDKILYDILVSKHMDNLRGYLSSKSQTFMSHSAHFVENHDEPRAVAEFGGPMQANAAAAISFLLPGIRLQFHGQWEGKRNRLDVHLRRDQQEPVDEGTAGYYKKLNEIISHEIFHTGQWEFLNVSHHEGDHDTWRLASWSWHNDETNRVVIVNYSEGDASGHVTLPPISVTGPIKIRELMSQKVYDRDASSLYSTGLHVVLSGWRVQVFEYPA